MSVSVSVFAVCFDALIDVSVVSSSPDRQIEAASNTVLSSSVSPYTQYSTSTVYEYS